MRIKKKKARKKITKLQQWKRHKAKWGDCTRCSLSAGAHRYVFGRGKIPADILLVGEGPRELEDLQGKPFVGTAGKYLDQALTQVHAEIPFSCFITNIVACRPTSGGIGCQTMTEDARACQPRLKEIVKIVSPQIILTLNTKAFILACGLGAERVYYSDFRHPNHFKDGCFEDSDIESFTSHLLMYVKLLKNNRLGLAKNENQKKAKRA